MQGDYYIGRGSRERNLKPSVFGNPFKVAVHGRSGAIRRYEAMLRKNDDLLKRLPQLSGFRLVCHCRANQACHAESIIKVYKSLFPAAFNREDIATATAGSEEVLSRLASLREVPDSDDGSTADEGAPARGTGWECRLDRGIRGETYATARHWHLQAAGLWNTENIPTVKRGDVSQACAPISLVAWAHQLCSLLSHPVKSRNVPSAQTVSSRSSTQSYEVWQLVDSA